MTIRNQRATSARRRARVRAAACAAWARCPASSTAATRARSTSSSTTRTLFQNLRNEKFHASILTLDAGRRRSSRCCCARCNMHPFKPQVQHIDFQRVSKDKKIHMKVPLHFVNAEKSPGVKEQGGVVSHVLNELDIICLPGRPAGVHRGRSRRTSRSATRCTCATSRCRRASSSRSHKTENPVVATVVDAALVTEEEEAAADAAVVAPPRCRPPSRPPRRRKARARLPRARRATSGKGAAAEKRQGRRGREARRCRQGREEREEVSPGSASSSAWAIPGKEYERTRHNAGFWLVERFAAAKRRRAAQGREVPGAGRRRHRAAAGAWLLLPQTLHERERPARCRCSPASSRSSPKRSWWCTTSSTSRPASRSIKQGGGIAGHNGLKDISQRLGTHDYWRLRIGVGKPPAGARRRRLRAQRPPAEEQGGDRRGDRQGARSCCRRCSPATCRAR